MEVAFELTPLVASKLIIYSFGALVHLFLMVLILGQRGLKWLEWLLFCLMSGLFMWNSGNLLALNVGLFNGTSPPILSSMSRAIAFLGQILIASLLVHVDVQIVSATNKDLATEITKQTFREDLYYRLRVVSLKLPPLREHKEDILVLAAEVCWMLAEKHGRSRLKISREAMDLLLSAE